MFKYLFALFFATTSFAAVAHACGSDESEEPKKETKMFCNEEPSEEGKEKPTEESL